MGNSSPNKYLEAILMLKTVFQIISLVVSAAVLSLIGAVSTQAQTQYRANIPFDFSIGEKHYKAGNYGLDTLRPNSARKPIALRDAAGRSLQILMENPGENYSKVKTATLVFDQNESHYSLASIRTPTFIVKFRRSNTGDPQLADLKAQRIISLAAKK